MTLIGNRYPRKLVRYLTSLEHVRVEPAYPEMDDLAIAAELLKDRG